MRRRDTTLGGINPLNRLLVWFQSRKEAKGGDQMGGEDECPYHAHAL